MNKIIVFLLLSLFASLNATRTYDWVVIGAGSAGCIAAGELDQAGYSVKLLESGPELAPDNVLFETLFSSATNWFRPWVRDNYVQANALGRRTNILTANMLGGGGHVNTAIAWLADKNYWNSYEQLYGMTGWNYNTIVPAFTSLKSKVSFEPVYFVPDSSQKFALSGAATSFYNPDFNNPAGNPTNGFGSIQVNTKTIGGVPYKDYTLKAYLESSSCSVDISTKSTVVKINTKQKNNGLEATTVDYIEDGVSKKVKARNVVLAAGAFGSPEILQRSGFYLNSELVKLGIPNAFNPPVDLPVGDGLKDHTALGLTYQNFCPLAPSDFAKLVLTPGTQVAGFDSSNITMGNWSNIQFTYVPIGADSAGLHFDQFLLTIFLVDPESSGSVKIASTDPFDLSIKTFDFSGTENDVTALAYAIEKAEAFMAQGPFAECLGQRINPPPNANLRDFIKQNGLSGYHPACTNAMGKVVDKDLKVYGTKNLYVIDASVMPRISNCNTNVPTEMIAVKGIKNIINNM